MFPVVLTDADKLLRFRRLHKELKENKIDTVTFAEALGILFTSREEFNRIMKGGTK